MSEEILREIVASVGRIDRVQITASTPLTGLLSGSLGRARLDALVRSKLGVSNSAIYRVATFGELCELVGVTASSNGSTAAPVGAERLPRLPESGNGIKLGVDVESIASLPAATDYWDDGFYKRTFTAKEIAYALLQTSPRASLAAMWCAKEAMRKAFAALAEADWQRMEIVHGADGKPEAFVDGKAISGALSLSHTDDIAFAAFVAGYAEQRAPAVPPPAPQQIVLAAPMRPSKLPGALAFLALLAALAALALTFLHR